MREFNESDLMIDHLKRGDESALVQIEKHLYRRMLRAAYQVTSLDQLAEDAVCISLAKIWKKRDLLPANWQDATRYILQMVTMTTIDLIRTKEERTPKVDLDEARTVAMSSNDDSDVSDDINTAMTLVQQRLTSELTNRHWRVLRPIADELANPGVEMRDAYALVASTKGLSAGAVRNTWSDAGKKLQTILHELGWHDFSEDDVRHLLQSVALHGAQELGSEAIAASRRPEASLNRAR